jgi:hypothetical protein
MYRGGENQKQTNYLMLSRMSISTNSDNGYLRWKDGDSK